MFEHINYDFPGLFIYQVLAAKIVDPTATEYMQGKPGEYTATLMTCWPAGTTLKRLVVVGKLVD